MNNILIPISDLQYTVQRPVVLDVVRQLMDITQISSKTQVRVMDEDTRVLQKNSTIDKVDGDLNNWPYDDKITVEVSEEYEPSRMLSTPVKIEDSPLIFKDDALGIIIRPVYAFTNIVITFKYRADDKNKANMWRDNIRTKTSTGRLINLHELTYNYNIPKETIVLLDKIYALRQNQGGYNDTFFQYFREHLVNRATAVSSFDGKNLNWVIAEKQIRVQGTFDFEGVPDRPEREGDAAAYTTTFTYKFSYDKPINCNMVYPSIIHNQLLNKKYRQDSNEQYCIEGKNKSYSLSNLVFSRFEDTYDLLEALGNKGVTIPPFDESFYPNSIASGTCRVCTLLCAITEQDKRTLVNLKDLGEFNLSQDLLDFLKEERLFVGKTYASVFCLHLYENANLMPSETLKLDEDLNVLATLDLDIRKTYRVRLGVVVNLDMLNDGIMKRIKQYNLSNPIFAVKLAKSINSILRDPGVATNVSRNRLTETDLFRLGLSGVQNSGPIDYNKIRTRLVENFFIITRPELEN